MNTKALLIDTAPIPANPSTAHCRGAIELGKQLGIEVVSKIEDFTEKKPNDYQKFVVFGSAFYPKTAEIEAFIRKCANPKIFWINNEYTCSPNSEYASLIKDFESTVISNVVEQSNKVKNYNHFHLLNLNVLLAKHSNQTIFKKYDLCYFGTYRAGRRKYMQKYFSQSNFYLSSSKKNLRKFYQLAGCNAKFCDKFDWTEGKETLNLFKYSLYLEDEYTHTHFNHLSNRFYEALFCNVVQFFDKNCSATIKLSNLELDDYFFVDSPKELEEKVHDTDFEKALKLQRAWQNQVLQEKESVLKQLKSILL